MESEERGIERNEPYFNEFVFTGSCLRLRRRSLASIDSETEAQVERRTLRQRQARNVTEKTLCSSVERGLALVKATPDQFMEVARFKAIEGKTWNHPVVIGDLVLVRNGEEMAAFRLPLASR